MAIESIVIRQSASSCYLVCSYLSGVEAAEEITRQVLSTYSRHGVEPLVESSVTTEDELRHVKDLLDVTSG